MKSKSIELGHTPIHSIPMNHFQIYGPIFIHSSEQVHSPNVLVKILEFNKQKIKNKKQLHCLAFSFWNSGAICLVMTLIFLFLLALGRFLCDFRIIQYILWGTNKEKFGFYCEIDFRIFVGFVVCSSLFGFGLWYRLFLE